MTVNSEFQAYARTLSDDQLQRLAAFVARMESIAPPGSTVDILRVAQAVLAEPEQPAHRRYDPSQQDRIGARAYELTLTGKDYEEAQSQAEREIVLADIEAREPRRRPRRMRVRKRRQQ